MNDAAKQGTNPGAKCKGDYAAHVREIMPMSDTALSGIVDLIRSLAIYKTFYSVIIPVNALDGRI